MTRVISFKLLALPPVATNGGLAVACTATKNGKTVGQPLFTTRYRSRLLRGHSSLYARRTRSKDRAVQPSDRVTETATHGERMGVVLEWPTQRIDTELRIYCAYNATRQKFLRTFIETADLRPQQLAEHLRALAPGYQKALWLVPFRGIGPSDAIAPIDLVFLDQNYCVLAMAEAFPTAQPGPCNWPVGSAIAMPAGSIAASGTLTGDQLILCSPQKMNQRLLELQSSLVDEREPESFSLAGCSITKPVSNTFKSEVHVSTWEDFLGQAKNNRVPVENPPVTTPHLPVEQDEKAVQEESNRSRNWFLCLLAPNRKEKRESARESLPWVAAYFFNGETPAPATIRNISSLGMFVNTKERWNLGTIIPVTLGDWRLPSPDRAMTVSAMVVRSDESGVGLRFVFPKQRRRNARQEPSEVAEITREQLREFLHRFKGNGRPFISRQKIFG